MRALLFFIIFLYAMFRATTLILGFVFAGLAFGIASESRASSADSFPEKALPARPTGFWAHVSYAGKIRKTPSHKARKVGRLRFFTEDGFPETYAVYKSRRTEGNLWYKIGIPARPNGQKGWVLEGALGDVHTSYKELRINRRRFVAKLWENVPGGGKELVWRARVGVGAPGTETPGGRFWIRERIKGFQSGTVYGYMAFGTSAYSKLSDWPGGGVVGIHGTNEPELIPGAVSHGCIRIKNKKIYKLSKRLSVGTPIRIY